MENTGSFTIGTIVLTCLVFVLLYTISLRKEFRQKPKIIIIKVMNALVLIAFIALLGYLAFYLADIKQFALFISAGFVITVFVLILLKISQTAISYGKFNFILFVFILLAFVIFKLL